MDNEDNQKDEQPSQKRQMNIKKLHELRERLYERNGKTITRGRTPLQSTAPAHRQTFATNGSDASKQAPEETGSRAVSNEQPIYREKAPTSMPYKQPKRSYRLKILVAGTLFFVLALLASSAFLFFGNNMISGDNITIDVSGPFAVGGGEKLDMQVAISNLNSLPIESATLIIEYPLGTQSASDVGKELFSERQQLNVIDSGEVVNVPVSAIVFGEENDEKTIKVAVEYRVRGSNATFFKEAEPLRFKISSSPVVLSVDSVRRISAGQEAEITLTVGSNSPNPLSDVLIKAIYPFGFDFSDSDPDTVSGRDTWLISSLEPEEKEQIVIRGVVTGKQDEERVFEFSAGVPNERDPFTLASVFTTVGTQMSIEQPFLNVGVAINGETSETVAVESERPANVRISFTNSLDDTLYDGKIEAKLSGNALDKFDVKASTGFYDSNTNTITWDSVDVRALEEIAPGKTSDVSFNIEPLGDVSRTPEIRVDVTIRANRVFEDRVPQELVGTTFRKIRVESITELTSATLHDNGPFINTGPIPPVIETLTQYTLSFEMQNGSNDITDAKTTAVLPQYITWLDLKTSGDDVTYNPTSRVVTWDIGDMDANEKETMAFQVSFVPSTSQVNTSPTVLETQRFRATDRFTGTTIRTDAPALTTILHNDSIDPDESGDVISKPLDEEEDEE